MPPTNPIPSRATILTALDALRRHRKTFAFEHNLWVRTQDPNLANAARNYVRLTRAIAELTLLRHHYDQSRVE